MGVIFKEGSVMHRNVVYILCVLLIASGSLVAASLLSATAPGTAGDPLITESFLRQEMAGLQSELDQRWQTLRDEQAELGRRLRLLEQGGSVGTPNSTLPTTGNAAPGELRALELRLESLEIQMIQHYNRLERFPALENQIGLLLADYDIPQPGESGLQVYSLPAGAALLAGAGSELILRAGTVTVIAAAAGGLADLTAGRDLQAGEEVSANHLLLVPREDGRGVEAVTDAVLLVRGSIWLR